jgi:hypothetical protein
MAANTSNTRKPSGPNTPEGKARVAKNRLRSGAYAEKHSLYALPQAQKLSSSVRHRYYSTLDDHLEIFQPSSNIAQSYVVAMARDHWRLELLPLLEAALFAPNFHAKAPEFEAVFPELHPFLCQPAPDKSRITLLIGRIRRELTVSRKANLNLFLSVNTTFAVPIVTHVRWVDNSADCPDTTPLHPHTQLGNQQDNQLGDQLGDQLQLPLLPEAA